MTNSNNNPKRSGASIAYLISISTLVLAGFITVDMPSSYREYKEKIKNIDDKASKTIIIKDNNVINASNHNKQVFIIGTPKASSYPSSADAKLEKSLFAQSIFEIKNNPSETTKWSKMQDKNMYANDLKMGAYNILITNPRRSPQIRKMPISDYDTNKYVLRGNYLYIKDYKKIRLSFNYLPAQNVAISGFQHKDEILAEYISYNATSPEDLFNEAKNYALKDFLRTLGWGILLLMAPLFMWIITKPKKS